MTTSIPTVAFSCIKTVFTSLTSSKTMEVNLSREDVCSYMRLVNRNQIYCLMITYDIDIEMNKTF